MQILFIKLPKYDIILINIYIQIVNIWESLLLKKDIKIIHIYSHTLAKDKLSIGNMIADELAKGLDKDYINV